MHATASPASRTAPIQPAREPAADGRRALSDLPREHGFEPLEVRGTIPADLRGTIYRNGATLFSSGGRRYDHWFDGDGGLAAVRYADGKALGAARVIESAGLLEERAAGKRLYGGFGSVQPGLLRRLRGNLKNVANTSVMFWNQRLLALMEAAVPTEVDPDTLATLGETDLGGVLAGAFSAHPHRVAARRATYNFGIRYGRNTVLDLYELPDAGAARRIGTLPLAAPTMIHDFIATDRHLVFFIAPLRLRFVRMFLGLGGFADNLAWRPELGTEVLVVPIDEPARATRFTTEAFHTWHFANAFERGGEIVIDFVRYPDFASNEWLTELFQGRGGDGGREPGALDGVLSRAVIDVAGDTLRCEARWDRPCEFPRVAPAVEGGAYRYCYLAAHTGADVMGFQDSVSKVDLETGAATTWRLPDGHYTSEPVFVPREGGGEDGGYLLAMVYDATGHRSYSAVLDARDVEAGPLATAHFDHHVPPRFHGIWVG